MELSTGECLHIRRRRANLTQEAIAKKYNVAQQTVCIWESDGTKFPGIVNPVSDMTVGEECYILRRRLDMSIREAADLMHVSHVTIIRWEKENPPDELYRWMLLEKTAEKEMRELA